jgi:hypothetical protein
MRTFNAGFEQVYPATLNFVEGYTGTIVNCIVDHMLEFPLASWPSQTDMRLGPNV